VHIVSHADDDSVLGVDGHAAATAQLGVETLDDGAWSHVAVVVYIPDSDKAARVVTPRSPAFVPASGIHNIFPSSLRRRQAVLIGINAAEVLALDSNVNLPPLGIDRDLARMGDARLRSSDNRLRS